MLTILLAWFLCINVSAAADLPGVPLSFEVDSTGKWLLPADLPAQFAQAGVKPGWALTAVDGVRFDDPKAARRRVALGPARLVQLSFDTPEGETVLQVQRGDFVQLEELGILQWPKGFTAGASSWLDPGTGSPWLVDGAGAIWALDTATGGWSAVANGSGAAKPRGIPDVWFTLSSAPWVMSRPDEVTISDATGMRTTMSHAARIRRLQGRTGDHLVVPEPDGLEVLAVTWPRGTPELPECVPSVPETCLVAGRQIAAELIGRPGGKVEALRDFGVACSSGVYRACLEAVTLEQPELGPRAQACLDQDANACHEVARARLGTEPGKPDEILVGTLEFACSVDASGSLGERLRRLEDVGEGCMLLSAAQDRLGAPDRALLGLDQACVLGRAEACDEATRRRKEAFAMRTVRECEDPATPLPSSCVQLGHLLQAGPVSSTKLDDFGAFLRGCELGDEDGCVLLGDYVDRWGIDHPRVLDAENSLDKACKAGEQRACVGSAHLLVRHDPRSEAYAQALQRFADACAAGEASGCIAGAEQRRIGKARRVHAPLPIDMWSTACDLHSALGCAGLGERYYRSRRTWDEAYTAWTKSCETGEAGACTDLGRLVSSRHKTPWPQEQPADAYLKKGCENGNAEGCYWLAADDVPRHGDPPENAYLLLKRSCDGDYGEACAVLGRIHLERHTSFDDEIAAGRLQSACDNGHFESCRVLSEMYAKGKGVEKDRVKARELAQRYSVNARQRHVRLGAHIGFPYLLGGEGELVLPIPVGPALAVTGAYSYVPGVGGVMVLLKGGSMPSVAPALVYEDAGVRLYPNNKARGLYAMVGMHRLQATGGNLNKPLVRDGFSARLGMYSESKFLFTRVEMGLAQYGMVYLSDFDSDQTGKFPLLQPTLGFTIGVSLF
jgi:TPR repeat protein